MFCPVSPSHDARSTSTQTSAAVTRSSLNDTKFRTANGAGRKSVFRASYVVPSGVLSLMLVVRLDQEVRVPMTDRKLERQEVEPERSRRRDRPPAQSAGGARAIGARRWTTSRNRAAIAGVAMPTG